MENYEDTALTEEELDNVVGGEGRTFRYEFKDGKYKCSIYKKDKVIGHMDVGENKWNDFVKRLLDGNDSVEKIK